MIQTPLPDFTIREASPDDVPLVLSLIRELAEYEKLSSEVSANEALIRKSLFGDRKCAEAIIGEFQKQPVTFAVFFPSFSTFLGKPGIYLEDLYVKPAARGLGVGKAMLSYLAKLALERDCGRLEWSVLDWNEPALNFYNSIGAESMSGWTVQRLAGDALVRLADRFTI